MEFVNAKDRLTAPLLRRNGVLEEVDWDEALAYGSGRLRSYMGEGFAMLTSPTSTNEEHYLAQKFTRLVMASNNVDHTSNTHPELVLGWSLPRSSGRHQLYLGAGKAASILVSTPT